MKKLILALMLVGTVGYSAARITNSDIASNAAIAFSKLATLTSGNILVGSAGNVPTSVAMSGDATIVASGALTIAADAVTDAKLRESAALSVIGRSANSTGNPADIAAGTDHHILRRSGTSIGFGSIDLSQADAVGSSSLGVANGGTGQTSYIDGQLLIGNSTGGTLTKSTLTAGSGVTITNGNGSITIAASGGSFTSSYQYWDGAGSYGSTNTRIPRMGVQRANVGSDITCADSATLGFSCTINDTGVYEVALCVRVDGAVNIGVGFSVNGSALTTNVQSIDYSQGLRGMCYIGNSNAENTCCVTRTMPLTLNDVVRPHGDGTQWNNTQRTNFSVTKIQ